MSENESNNSSETFLEVINTIEIPIKFRDSDINFQEYRQLDGEWVEKGEPLCEIRFGQHLSQYGFLTSSMIIKSTKAGVLEFTLEKGDLLTDDTIIAKLHPKGQYLTKNIPQNFEYKEFFTESSQNLTFDKWLVLDGKFVKVGEPIFQFKDFKRQEYINYSKKEGFIHRPMELYSLEKGDLMYSIRDTDEQRIEELFKNHSNIILDEFTNSTIINWWSVSSGYPNREGVITKSDDFNTDFLFSFNFIEDNDYIVFQFNPKQIKPKQFDKVSFLFENGEQVLFELSTNPIQSKNSKKENILEYKSIITNSELHLFATSNFKKWKISLVSDKRDILGGNISGCESYHGENNIKIAIKKFANDYIDLVKETIPNYQPTILNETTEFKEKITEMCFVYLMHDTSNDYYKIGISNNPSYRERTLQSEKPTIEVIISKKFPVRKIAESIEKALHETYSEKRLRGEWFELDFIDVGHIKQTLS